MAPRRRSVTPTEINNLDSHEKRLMVINYFKAHGIYTPSVLFNAPYSYETRKYIFFILIYIMITHADSRNQSLIDIRNKYNISTSGMYDYQQTRRGYDYIMHEFFDDEETTTNIAYYLKTKRDAYNWCVSHPKQCGWNLPVSNEWDYLYGEYYRLKAIKDSQDLWRDLGSFPAEEDIFSKFQGIEYDYKQVEGSFFYKRNST